MTSTDAPQTKNFEILAVDDDAVIRKMYQSILKGRGYIIHLAENGEEAVKMASELSLNLIFLDIMMPVMDGFAALQALRALPRNANIPIIMVTSKSDMATVIKAIKLGANDFIAKPFTRSDILSKIKFAVEASKETENSGGETQKGILQRKNTFLDVRMFRKMQYRFVNNFESYYHRIIGLIAIKEKMELVRTLEGLKEICELYEFEVAQKKLPRMLSLTKSENYDEALLILLELYDDFAELKKSFESES